MKNSGIRFGFVVGTTSLAFVVSQLDVSIVNVALPQIGQSFSAGVSTLQWIVDAYSIAFAVLMLSAGGMSDLLGTGGASAIVKAIMVSSIISGACLLLYAVVVFRRLKNA